MGSSGLGTDLVHGLNLEPIPPARITTCMLTGLWLSLWINPLVNHLLIHSLTHYYQELNNQFHNCGKLDFRPSHTVYDNSSNHAFHFTEQPIDSVVLISGSLPDNTALIASSKSVEVISAGFFGESSIRPLYTSDLSSVSYTQLTLTTKRIV